MSVMKRAVSVMKRLREITRWETTTRSMRAEHGDPPAVKYPELARYSDAELLARDLREIVAEIEALRAANASQPAQLDTARTRQKVQVAA